MLMTFYFAVVLFFSTFSINFGEMRLPRLKTISLAENSALSIALAKVSMTYALSVSVKLVVVSFFVCLLRPKSWL